MLLCIIIFSDIFEKHMSKFNYRYTCPLIDKIISSSIQCIESNIDHYTGHIEDVVTEEFHNNIRNVIEEMRSDITHEISGILEEFRSINSDMRDAAEEQIANIINNHESEISDKDCEIHDMSCTIDELRDEITRLNEIIDERD